MVNLLPASYEQPFMTFIFILMRVTAAIFAMPVLGGKSVPRPVRAGIAFMVALLLAGPHLGLTTDLTGAAPPPSTRIYNGIMDFALAGISEFLIGFVLGFMFQVLVGAVGLAGEVIGKQGGFSAASVFDPITGTDNFLLAQINVWIVTLLFLAIDGPEMVLQTVAQSFHFIAPGQGFSFTHFSEASARMILFDVPDKHNSLMTILYIMGMRLALPMIGGMLLVSLAEAFIARTAPQLNIMSVGFAIRMSMALFILSLLMKYIVVALKPHLLLYPSYSDAFLSWFSTT